MMKVTSKLTFNAAQVDAFLDAGTLAVVTALAEDAQQKVKTRLEVPPQRTGERYLLERPDGTLYLHIASAPRESPAPDTRNLKESIETDVQVLAPGIASAKIGPDMEKAPYADLELGIPVMKIAPRPYLRPVFILNAKAWIKDAEAHYAAILAGLGL